MAGTSGYNYSPTYDFDVDFILNGWEEATLGNDAFGGWADKGYDIANPARPKE